VIVYDNWKEEDRTGSNDMDAVVVAVVVDDETVAEVEIFDWIVSDRLLAGLAVVGPTCATKPMPVGEMPTGILVVLHWQKTQMALDRGHHPVPRFLHSSPVHRRHAPIAPCCCCCCCHCYCCWK
jgi:hypothetical protein